MKTMFSKSSKVVFVFFLSALLLLSTKGFSTEIVSGANWVFLQLVSSGSFEPIEGDSKHYMLTLQGVSPNMVSFTDRPARSAMAITTKAFTEKWGSDQSKNNYRENPPNASLVLSTGKFEDVVILSLENPVYDEKNQTVTYKVTPIKLLNEHKLDCRIREELPKTFKEAVLFIDDSWGSLGG